MLWLVPLFPIITGSVIATAGDRSRVWLGIIATLTIGATLGLTILAAAQDWTATLMWSDAIRLSAALTPLSAAIALMVPTVALAVVFHATQHEATQGLGRLTGLMILFTGGMQLVVVADDLLTLLIGWEFIGACSWALIAHKWRDIQNPKSGLYAFVVTRFGDLGLFAAAMALFAGTGSFDYAGIATLSGPTQFIVAYGILLSAASKAGQVPFAPWLFRAMAGPSSVSALLHAATLVAAGAYIIARLHPSLSVVPGWQATTIAIGLTTALMGGFTGVLQNHAKRLLAASTSAQMGFVFIAVGAGYPDVAALHLIVHATFKAPLFLVAGAAGDATGSYRLDRMRLGRILPLIAGLAAIAAVGLAGLPLTGGGWSKEEIVKAAEQTDFWLAIGVMIGGALSATYATRFLLLAFGRRREDARVIAAPGWSETIGIATLSALTLGLGLMWGSPLSDALPQRLGLTLPNGTTLGHVLSLTFVTTGLAIGVHLVRHNPALGRTGAPAAAADWLGLPTLITRCIVRPVEAMARAAARVDDDMLDAVPRSVAALAQSGSATIAVADNRVVDRAIGHVAALGDWLARIGNRFGEALSDGIPEGTADITGMLGREVRRLQSGLSHHYYAYIIGGVFAVIAILAAGA